MKKSCVRDLNRVVKKNFFSKLLKSEKNFIVRRKFVVDLGNISNNNESENTTNLHILREKTIALHALHFRLSFW